ncbi:F0F1 ATP synthase subunit B family protein [Anaerocaecibacter muris]|uniref:F0F1 ATP synthase subunit B family protein n=1 Tax=Anaerocaecibacter muris TaxID=2941513 RepID=UPI003F68CFE1
MITFISEASDILTKLGLDWKSILFYVVNFIILLGALIALLYKPVKKMLKNKRQSIDGVYAENEQLKAESEKLKVDYDKMVADMKLENARVAAKVADAAQELAIAVLAEAQEQAQSIVNSAKKEAATQMEQLKGEYRNSVNGLAVQIAEKLLEREISDRDNAALIEQVLSDWEDAD